MTARLQLQHHWKSQEKPAIFFLLKLLFLLSLIKLVFFGFNHESIQITSAHATWKMLQWSLFYDGLVIALINLPFLFLLWLLYLIKFKIPVVTLNVFFICINLFCLLINIADIPYFHFHAQRADADLLYVIKDPVEKTFVHHPLLTFSALLVIFILCLMISRIHKKVLKNYKDGFRKFPFSIIIVLLSVFLISISPKKFVPTYPLTNISSSELQVVQNSFHTFLYSVFRNEDASVRPYTWMNDMQANQYLSQKKFISSSRKKNVVLFIMESIPEDYFNVFGKYKVEMPFLDSLLQHSTYFTNAFSYSHNSNKGIVALLAGLPTLTEIPLYHSRYADLPKSSIGKILKTNGYTSSFTIGDAYDDFGFAKCCNWLGFDNYYCREDIPDHNKMEYHTMGLHDEYVLNFLGNKLAETQQPFLAVQYNISTHYPNDLPKNYIETSRQNFSAGMKSMHYYSECLRTFFNNASTQKWFSETVFIFASDHWMYPDDTQPKSDVLQRFRIPVFIFDPSVNQKKEITSTVSQLDIMNTILNYTGVKDSIISYGENLADVPSSNRVVFMRENNTLYQAVDSSLVIGFNPLNDKVEFVYDYKKDPAKRSNLAGKINIDYQLNSLKAFLQKASLQYNKQLH